MWLRNICSAHKTLTLAGSCWHQAYTRVDGLSVLICVCTVVDNLMCDSFVFGDFLLLLPQGGSTCQHKIQLVFLPPPPTSIALRELAEDFKMKVFSSSCCLEIKIFNI